MTKYLKAGLALLFSIALFSFSVPEANNIKGLGKPPATWQEHWFEHEQLVSLVHYDNDLAVYYDKEVDRSVTWPFATLSQCWAYVKKTYGGFGDSSRLYVILHQGKYGGGHPASYFDESHDYRNMIDCGLGNWRDSVGQNLGMPVHEMGHIVCGANHGVKGSPSDQIWGDSKFMEIFIYDVYLHIGKQGEAAKVYQQMSAQDPNSDFPGNKYPGTRWFINWFYPIYTQYGKATVLNKYFGLLAANYPKNGNEYTDREMNLGEFVHFWSGAAGVDLRGQAKTAFGKYWDEKAENDFEHAQKEFAKVQYKAR